MRNVLSLVFFLPLLMASGGCGQEISHSLTSDAGSKDDTRDDGGEPDGGGCVTDIPLVACPDPCGGNSTGPQCIDGEWICPAFNGAACIEDAGPDACSDTVGACSGDTYCTGAYLVPTCFDGIWSCVWEGECEDGGEPDAGPPPDASPPLFACGDQACDPSRSYCQITTGGPVNEDGGANSGYECQPLPSSCVPGQQATCDCITAFEGVSPTCSCIGENGDVIVTCDVP